MRKKIETMDFPNDWESCNEEQLAVLARDGAYGQRLTARRYLLERAKIAPEKQAALLRKLIKALGPE